MFFMKRKKRDEIPTLHATVSITPPIDEATQSIATRQDAVHEAKVANAELTRLLVENGFTLQIYLAAGGKHPRSKGHTK